MAQSSRWRLAKSREAIATATAASSAASSATRLRNFSARSSVWRISGRPLSSDSIAHAAQRLGLESRPRPRRRTRRPWHRCPSASHREPVGDAAGRLDQAGGGEVGVVEHHPRREAGEAGAAVGLDQDDAGRRVRLASPSSSGSPTLRPSESSTAASTQTVPGAGALAASSAGFAAGGSAQPQLAAQRVGVADRLDADQPGGAALARRAPGPCSGSWRWSPSPGPARAPWPRRPAAPAGRWRRSRRRRAAGGRRAPGRR